MGNMLLQIGGLVLVFFLFVLILLFTRYKRCPSDRILVVYGKTGRDKSSTCIHGGAKFVIPLVQDYGWLDLTPVSIDVDLTGALSKQNIRVNVPSQFTVGISKEPGIMENAADRLLGASREEMRNLAENIITGQLRLVVATMDIEEINADRDKFLENVELNVGKELSKIGLKLINVNVTDIQDESGYIEALGKEAAAKAINDAKKSVAEKNRDGSIGASIADKEERIQVSEAVAMAKAGEAEASKLQRIEVANANAKAEAAEAEALGTQRIKVANANAMAESGEAEAQRLKRIQIAEANAKAVEGENESAIQVAKSNALRREKEAEALKLAITAEKIQSAKALEEAYAAEKAAEIARAEREMASKQADIIVQAQIMKEQIEIQAEAEAEKIRRRAQGEADAIYLKKEAEAKGMFEILTKQAEGFNKIVDAADGNTKDAVLMMIADKLEDLVKTQVDAIKGIKIDKVTVWEGGNQEGEGNSTSKFVSGLYKSVPPLQDLFNMAGMNLPNYLGKGQEEKVSTNGQDNPPAPPLKDGEEKKG